MAPSSLRKAFLLALPLLAAALANKALGDAAWQPFTAGDASFRVDMPGSPEVDTRERWFPASRFVSTVYKVRRGADAFGVNHTDLPGAVLFVTSNRYILKSARDGFLESSRATEISFTKSELDGHPAQELIYNIPAYDNNPAQRGTAKLLFVGKRLFIFYTEMNVSADPKQTVEEVQRFFLSVELPPEN
ncbi:MAG: hypothetical protein OSB70_14890 [Myxococcota bacterium]|nr:hypothetical protein [Myxococcota bacterium]